jgi:hypothetical protein
MVLDSGNSVIRKVSSGIITTVAGIPRTPGFSGDGGPANLAKLGFPEDLAVDTQGSLYISERSQTDLFGFTSRIRKIFPNNTMVTLAGTGIVGFSGDGGPANFAGITAASISVDLEGNLLIADSANNRIRKILASNNIINTIVGRGLSGTALDFRPALDSTLFFNRGVAVDSQGKMVFGDRNVVFQLLTPTSTTSSTIGITTSVSSTSIGDTNVDSTETTPVATTSSSLADTKGSVPVNVPVAIPGPAEARKEISTLILGSAVGGAIAGLLLLASVVVVVLVVRKKKQNHKTILEGTEVKYELGLM